LVLTIRREKMTEKKFYLKTVPDVLEFQERMLAITREMIMSLKPFLQKYEAEVFMNCFTSCFCSVICSALKESDSVDEHLDLIFKLIRTNVNNKLNEKT